MENDEIIGSDSQPHYTQEETIAGSNGYSKPPSGDPSKKEEPVEQLTLAEMLTAETKAGGLTEISTAYKKPKQKDIEGPWSHIRFGKDPFKVLFLDYRLHRMISPAMVESNYNLLSAYWAETYNILEGVGRAKVTSRFGEEFVPQVKAAAETLKKAYNQIRTQEGIELWANNLNSVRIAEGTAKLKEFFDHDVRRGVYEKEDGLALIEKGLRYDLSEEEVRGFIYNQLVILGFSERADSKQADFLDNEWMSEAGYANKRARSSVRHTVLDRSVSSVQQLGKVLYDQPAQAKQRYIHSTAYLPGLVSTFEGSDAKGRVYENMINEEKDIDIRFLKIIYRLNPSLPFKIDEQDFDYISNLFAQTKNSKSLFLNVIESFKKGHLQLWLQATDQQKAALLPSENNYVGFLRFLLKIEPSHPVIISNELFETPSALISKAKNDPSYWPKITEAVGNGILPAWFEGIGKSSWNREYNTAIEPIINAGYYTEQDKKTASVFTLMKIIDPTIKNPEVVTETKSISLLSVDASKGLTQPVSLKLQNTGFVKTRIYIDQPVEGISLPQNTVAFSSQNNAAIINVVIDPIKLDKDKTYTLHIIVESIYQTITIPFTIRVIFPRSAYVKYLLKYGAFGMLFFFIIRLLLTAFTQDSRMYFTDIPSAGSFWGNSVEYQFGYVLAFLILLFGIWGAYRLTKNKEKI
jgi:hypothetical protein